MYHRNSQYFANLRWLWERIICVLGQLHPHHWVHGTLMTVWMTFSQKVNYIRYSIGIFRDQGLRKSDLHDYQYHNIIITAHLIILFTWIRDLTIMLSLSLSLICLILSIPHTHLQQINARTPPLPAFNSWSLICTSESF